MNTNSKQWRNTLLVAWKYVLKINRYMFMINIHIHLQAFYHINVTYIYLQYISVCRVACFMTIHQLNGHME